MTPKKTLSEKRLDRDIEVAYYRLAQDVEVNVMDIPKIFRDVKLEVSAGATLDAAVELVIRRYRVN